MLPLLVVLLAPLAFTDAGSGCAPAELVASLVGLWESIACMMATCHASCSESLPASISSSLSPVWTQRRNCFLPDTSRVMKDLESRRMSPFLVAKSLSV